MHSTMYIIIMQYMYSPTCVICFRIESITGNTKRNIRALHQQMTAVQCIAII